MPSRNQGSCSRLGFTQLKFYLLVIISLVVAASENNVIGKDNQLVWRLPNDMKFFKNTTWGMPVVMGRKTFESLGKALPGRTNIVITRNGRYSATDVTVTKSLNEAIKKAAETDAKEVFIIGGGEIYKEALPRANKLFLTRVHAIVEGDTFFPEFDQGEWDKKSELNFTADEKHTYDYSLQVWERKTAL